MQSRKMSLTEIITSTTIGYITAILTQLFVFPLFNINLPLTTNLAIGLIFTLISIIRGYFVRRLFNLLGKSNG